MTELFAFGRAAESETSNVSYGLGGDMKKTQYVLQLLGFPGDADTLKCLLTAVEMGLETDSGVLDILEGQEKSSDYCKISPFSMVPVLKEADYYVAGASGIMSYIEARGLGTRLPPKNVVLLAKQNYWSDIACSEVGPHVNTIVQEIILTPLKEAEASKEHIREAKQALTAPLEALNSELANNEFIIGNYSFADIHWTAYIHLLYEAGEGDLIDQYDNVKRWFNKIRTKKSFSGQNITAYDLLPKLADIQHKQLNSVIIDDY